MKSLRTTGIAIALVAQIGATGCASLKPCIDIMGGWVGSSCGTHNYGKYEEPPDKRYPEKKLTQDDSQVQGDYLALIDLRQKFGEDYTAYKIRKDDVFAVTLEDARGRQFTEYQPKKACPDLVCRVEGRQWIDDCREIGSYSQQSKAKWCSRFYEAMSAYEQQEKSGRK